MIFVAIFSPSPNSETVLFLLATIPFITVITHYLPWCWIASMTHTHTRWNSRRRSQECDSVLKRSNKYCTVYLLKRLVFEMQVAVKGCKISDHQTKGTSAPSYTYSVWSGRSERSHMDPVNCQEVLGCPSVGLFAVLLWHSSEHRDCRFIAAVVAYIGRCPCSPWVTGSRSALLTPKSPRLSQHHIVWMT